VQYRLLELAHFGINVECHYTTSLLLLLGRVALYRASDPLRAERFWALAFGVPRCGYLIGKVNGRGDLTESLAAGIEERVEHQSASKTTSAWYTTW